VIRSILHSALLLLWLAFGPPAMAQPQRGPLVLAASSLQEAMSAAADAWAARHHPRPVVSFAASSALARQVEAKAPADLFVSADEEWMTYVETKGLIAPRTRVSFLTNQLVLVAPAAARLGSLPVRPGFPLARELRRALAGGRLAMADPDVVPAGRYGKQALTRLGVWSQVEGSVARAENVRAALALVARGTAPLGVVYLTDARVEPAVRVVGVFPAGSHTPITYPLARLAASTNPDAEGFRRFLLSAEGKAIFRRFGFTPR